MSEHTQAMANSILQATAAKSGPTPDLGPSRWVKFHSFKKVRVTTVTCIHFCDVRVGSMFFDHHLSQATWSSGSGPSGASDMGVISSADVKSGSGLVVDTGKLQLPPEKAIGDVYCVVLHALETGDPVVSPTVKSCLYSY